MSVAAQFVWYLSSPRQKKFVMSLQQFSGGILPTKLFIVGVFEKLAGWSVFYKDLVRSPVRDPDFLRKYCPKAQTDIWLSSSLLYSVNRARPERAVLSQNLNPCPKTTRKIVVNFMNSIILTILLPIEDPTSANLLLIIPLIKVFLHLKSRPVIIQNGMILFINSVSIDFIEQ